VNTSFALDFFDAAAVCFNSTRLALPMIRSWSAAADILALGNAMNNLTATLVPLRNNIRRY
jgi:hypothetical protein